MRTSNKQRRGIIAKLAPAVPSAILRAPWPLSSAAAAKLHMARPPLPRLVSSYSSICSMPCRNTSMCDS